MRILFTDSIVADPSRLKEQLNMLVRQMAQFPKTQKAIQKGTTPATQASSQGGIAGGATGSTVPAGGSGGGGGSVAWSSITGKPTTLAGYGITDPVVLTSGSYANPAWITSLAWSKLTGVPSYEPAVAAGTSAQYYRGDKTWQTLNQAAVAGLTVSDKPTFAGAVIKDTGAHTEGRVELWGWDAGGSVLGWAGVLQGAYGVFTEFTTNSWFKDSDQTWHRIDVARYAVLNQLLGNTTSGSFEVYISAPQSGVELITNWDLVFNPRNDGGVVTVNSKGDWSHNGSFTLLSNYALGLHDGVNDFYIYLQVTNETLSDNHILTFSDLAGTVALIDAGQDYTNVHDLHVMNRAYLGVPNSAPVDGDLANGQASFYVDQTNNLLKCRVKYSTGVLKSVQWALT